jgi:hypothetical protein
VRGAGSVRLGGVARRSDRRKRDPSALEKVCHLVMSPFLCVQRLTPRIAWQGVSPFLVISEWSFVSGEQAEWLVGKRRREPGQEAEKQRCREARRTMPLARAMRFVVIARPSFRPSLVPAFGGQARLALPRQHGGFDQPCMRT